MLRPDNVGRRGPLYLVVLVVAALGLAACSSSGAAPPPAPPPGAAVSVQPTDRAADISPAAPARVSVADGRLMQVALTSGDGAAVAGAPSPDGRTWTSTGPLAYDTTYTWSGSAIGENNQPVPVAGTFTTVNPQQKAQASIQIPEGDSVGIGAPIIVQFDQHIDDKAAAQRAMSVQSSIPTEGSWAWLPDTADGSRAHWRPKEYWTPGTQVTVDLAMLGVPLGGGAWGNGNVVDHFTIGRSQIVKADVNSHQMVVVRDGQTVMTIDASYGLGSDPNRNTTNGIHVVMDKQENVLMSNPAYGYKDVPEHWAVRISNNGEYIHANPATTGDQGSINVTHGCVNLSTQDAEAYFNTALYGDPVEVTGSPVPMPRTDIYDWSLSWNEWLSMSALPA